MEENFIQKNCNIIIKRGKNKGKVCMEVNKKCKNLTHRTLKYLKNSLEMAAENPNCFFKKPNGGFEYVWEKNFLSIGKCQ